MNIKRLKIAAIIIAIGLVLSLAACLFNNTILTPAIAEKDFNYSVTYKLNGETKTLEGVYKCKYDGYRQGQDPHDRYYTEEYTVDGETTASRTYTIAEKDGIELYIVTSLDAHYLMGDTDNDSWSPLEDPFLEAEDQQDNELEQTQMLEMFDAEIISWEYPEPVKNTFAFSGFSIMHTGSMLAMLLAGLLTVIACMIFVRKDTDVSYKSPDQLSLAFNFIISIIAIPFITLVIGLAPLTMDTTSFEYQFFLCIPALTAFTVAASIALRRKGFAKSGLIVQFVGPVLFFVPVIVESIIINIFG